jgi:hypothetical protein
MILYLHHIWCFDLFWRIIEKISDNIKEVNQQLLQLFQDLLKKYMIKSTKAELTGIKKEIVLLAIELGLCMNHMVPMVYGMKCNLKLKILANGKKD